MYSKEAAHILGRCIDWSKKKLVTVAELTVVLVIKYFIWIKMLVLCAGNHKLICMIILRLLQIAYREREISQ